MLGDEERPVEWSRDAETIAYPVGDRVAEVGDNGHIGKHLAEPERQSSVQHAIDPLFSIDVRDGAFDVAGTPGKQPTCRLSKDAPTQAQ